MLLSGLTTIVDVDASSLSSAGLYHPSGKGEGGENRELPPGDVDSDLLPALQYNSSTGLPQAAAAAAVVDALCRSCSRDRWSTSRLDRRVARVAADDELSCSMTSSSCIWGGGAFSWAARALEAIDVALKSIVSVLDTEG